MLKKRILLFIIPVLAFIQYSNTLNFGFAWDDKIVIEENPRVSKGISSIPDLFVKYNSQYRNDKYGYRPIVLSSFAIEVSLAGKNPGFHHFMNAVYYALTCLVLFIFLQRLFREKVAAFSFFITLLFIVHPVHVEAVANIKSRDEIFCLLFSLLSFIFFLRAVDTGKWQLMVPVFLLYVLAYLSKENAFTTLGIYPLLFLCRREAGWKKIFLYSLHIPLLILLSLFILRSAESSTAGKDLTEGLGIYEETPLMGNSLFFVHGFSAKLANALHLLLRYLKLFLVPYPLVYFYGYNVIPVVSWAHPLVWLSLLIHAALFTLGILKRKERPEILFGLLFYLCTIFLYIHLLRPLSDTMADRFLFMPSVGLCILLAGLLGLVFRIDWKKGKTEIPLPEFLKKHKPLSGIVMTVALVFFVLSFQRNTVWKNDYTLVSNDIKNLENCSRAHFYYATQLNKKIQENPNRTVKLEPEMVKHYLRSIEITDSAYYAYLELGVYYCNRYRYDEGINILKKAADTYTQAADPSFFLGQAYVHKEQYALAVPYLERSLEKAPRQWGSYFFLSISWSKTGKHREGLELANKGLQMFPGFEKEFYDALGHIYYDMKDMPHSVEATLKMMQYGSPPKDVYGRIIGRYYALGDKETGDKYLEEARSKGIVFQ